VAWLAPVGSSVSGVWIADGDGTSARCLVDPARTRVENPALGNHHTGNPAMPLGERFAFSDLTFAPDGRELYFEDYGWGTSRALYAVAIDTGAVRFVLDANAYRAVDSCRDASLVGRILTYEHSHWDPLPGAVADWYFLADPQGKRLGIVGPAEENVQRFMARRCGQGEAPPEVPREPVPPSLRGGSRTCGNIRFEHRALPFLDGTTYDIYVVFEGGRVGNTLTRRADIDPMLRDVCEAHRPSRHR